MFKKGDIVTWVGGRMAQEVIGNSFDVLVLGDVESRKDLFVGVVVRVEDPSRWPFVDQKEEWYINSFRLKEEKRMKDVEQYIKPFNRFEMANGKRGVFLDFEGEVCAVYFEANVWSTYHSNVLYNILEGDTHYRAVKIWEKERGGADITSNFNYDATPIWQEESEEQRERRKQIEQLEETIKKAQQQITYLKETM